MVRHRVRHRYPWSRRALEVLRAAISDGRTFRELARLLYERRLTPEIVDAATVRRAVLRAGKEGR